MFPFTQIFESNNERPSRSRFGAEDKPDEFETVVINRNRVPYFPSGMFSEEASPSEEAAAQIHSIVLNQNKRGLIACVGHDTGYMFHHFKNGLEAMEVTRQPVDGYDGKDARVYIAERLFATSLVAFVTRAQVRHLQVQWNNKTIYNNFFNSAILAVKLNRQVIVICQQNTIHINSIRDMQPIHKISDTPSNKKGIIDLSTEGNILAFPGDPSGYVVLFDVSTMSSIYSIMAHTSSIAALRLNAKGTLLATASEKGTVIRVFSTKSGKCLYEFTRGVSRCVEVYSMAFSDDSKFLCLSSCTDTVHVFHLDQGSEEHAGSAQSQQEGLAGWMNYLSDFLPAQVNDYMHRGKSAAIARLPRSGLKTVVAIPVIDGRYHVTVGSMDGYLFRYLLDLETGICPLFRQSRIGPYYVEEENNDEGTIRQKIRSSEKPADPQPAVSSISIKKKKSSSSESSSLQELHGVGKEKEPNVFTETIRDVVKEKEPNVFTETIRDVVKEKEPNVFTETIRDVVKEKEPSTAVSSGSKAQPQKPAPPPIPPAPKKRSDVAAPPSQSASVKSTTLMAATSTNPFDLPKNTALMAASNTNPFELPKNTALMATTNTNPFDLNDDAFDDLNKNISKPTTRPKLKPFLSHKKRTSTAAKAASKPARSSSAALSEALAADLDNINDFPLL